MSNKDIILIIIAISIISIFWTGVSSAADCSKCHTSGAEKINAKDTIEINADTCLKCHNPNYPPDLIGYNTHLVHVGKYSINVDYLTRHPKATDSLNCNSCHINIGENCKSCHIKNIPHIKPPLGDNCKVCHGEIDKLFRHPAINLKIHDLFLDSNDTGGCAMCHNQDDMTLLKLANDKNVPIEESHKLCYQCHSGYYNLWNSGLHYSNKTPPSTIDYRMVVSKRTNWEDKWRKENTCANCHNPHNPNELYQLPYDKRMDRVTDTSILTNTNFYICIIGVLVLIVCLAFMIKTKKLKLPILSKITDIKMSKIKMLKAKMPKIKIPKISMPISISVESAEKDEARHKKAVDEAKVDEAKVEGIKPEKAETGLIIKKERLKKIVLEIKKKKFLHRKDILFISGICIMLGLFYIIFGTFIPIMVVISESMSPNIEKGDVIFYTVIDKIDNIRTHKEGTDIGFGDYGDVIIYKGVDKKRATSYIHRAMYYVEKGDEMWPEGPNATYAGYITKGDNDLTNSKYDQQTDISRNRPVKRDQIIGVARFRIPYIGYIRIALS